MQRPIFYTLGTCSKPISLKRFESPGIMDLVGNYSFLIRRDHNLKFDGLAGCLFEFMGLFNNLPVIPSIEVFYYPKLDGILFFVIANFYLECFIEPVFGIINFVICSSSFPD
ncbi:MAG: hypothetical protein JW804_01875 [Sedimentisphaerales bacterium]|nr:hypothetical protein [Sedimentisphaerales bacterium]